MLFRGADHFAALPAGIRLVNPADRVHEEKLPIDIDGTGRCLGAVDFRDLSTFPADDFIEGPHPFATGRNRVAYLAVIEINARLFPRRTGNFKGRGRAAHAFQLNDVQQMQITQRALEFFALHARSQKRLH